MVKFESAAASKLEFLNHHIQEQMKPDSNQIPDDPPTWRICTFLLDWQD